MSYTDEMSASLSVAPLHLNRLLSCLAVLGLGGALLLTTVSLRGTEYDEQYTMQLVAGIARPAWPQTAFTAADARAMRAGSSDFIAIAENLRATDVHPPLYFWTASLWRDLVGPGLERMRLLSVVFALLSLIAVGQIARSARIRPALPMLFTLGCYGFVYTGAIARGFALAQLLSLCGVALLLRADGRRDRVSALAGGLMLGAASFTNYLSVFVAIAALLWLLIRKPGAIGLWLAAGLGFLVFLPADLWFFAAQHGTRIGQFPPFDMIHGVALLARFGAGAIFGGLPLYVTGTARTVLTGALGGVLAGLSALVVWRWRGLARPGAKFLLAMAVVAPAIGLMALGVIFDTTPIELRYLSFAVPFAALLLAGSLGTLPRQLAFPIAALVLTIQGISLAGLLTRSETMQPARAIAGLAASLAWPNAAVLVARGNDGVGVVGAFATEAPDWLPILVIDRQESPGQIRVRAGNFPRAVLALLEQDDSSRATAQLLMAAFTDQPCWRRAPGAFKVMVFDRICGP